MENAVTWLDRREGQEIEGRYGHRKQPMLVI